MIWKTTTGNHQKDQGYATQEALEKCEFIQSDRGSVHLPLGRNFQHAAIMRHGSWNTYVAIPCGCFFYTEGGFDSWRAALFFMYSRKVAFAPIRSQMIVQSGVSELPSVCLCSPKSAFVLAEKVKLFVECRTLNTYHTKDRDSTPARPGSG